MSADKRSSEEAIARTGTFPHILAVSVTIFVVLWLTLSLSCSAKPSDLKTLVPAETLVYLETNDLGAALQPLVDSKPFGEAAVAKPDLSALNGVQVAISITGFELSEEKLTDEHSIGKIQPRFVVVADTHAWNYQAVGFAEARLGSFVEKIHDSEPTVERSDKHGGNYFTWTATDGRKAYALVVESLIYFGNDETAIEKCLAVRKGEADSLQKSGAVPSFDEDLIAAGYVAPGGVSQIADVVALKYASAAGEVAGVQEAMVTIVPAIIRGTVGSAIWTCRRSDAGIEDQWNITLPGDIGPIFSETIVAGGSAGEPLLGYVPDDYDSVTRYNLKDSVVAWRALMLTMQKLAGASYSAHVGEFFQMVSAQYGISATETFLSATSPSIVTVNRQDSAAVIASVRDAEKLNTAIMRDDDDQAPAIQGISITGDDKLVQSCAAAGGNAAIASNERFARSAPIVTLSRDREIAKQVASTLARASERPATTTSITTTRFTSGGMVRVTTSDLGFIGWIIAQLAEE